jgi:ssDNA-binding Zn-finger/Zn-ribbon topoisomerase 1
MPNVIEWVETKFKCPVCGKNTLIKMKFEGKTKLFYCGQRPQACGVQLEASSGIDIDKGNLIWYGQKRKEGGGVEGGLIVVGTESFQRRDVTEID